MTKENNNNVLHFRPKAGTSGTFVSAPKTFHSSVLFRPTRLVLDKITFRSAPHLTKAESLRQCQVEAQCPELVSILDRLNHHHIDWVADIFRLHPHWGANVIGNPVNCWRVTINCEAAENVDFVIYGGYRRDAGLSRTDLHDLSLGFRSFERHLYDEDDHHSLSFTLIWPASRLSEEKALRLGLLRLGHPALNMSVEDLPQNLTRAIISMGGIPGLNVADLVYAFPQSRLHRNSQSFNRILMNGGRWLSGTDRWQSIETRLDILEKAGRSF